MYCPLTEQAIEILAPLDAELITAEDVVGAARIRSGPLWVATVAWVAAPAGPAGQEMTVAVEARARTRHWNSRRLGFGMATPGRGGY
jgi:hypothetical protein